MGLEAETSEGQVAGPTRVARSGHSRGRIPVADAWPKEADLDTV
jgi:hypothetical protein